MEIKVNLPATLPTDERSALLAAELRRGRELTANGSISAIWRIPGAFRNVGVWEAANATELHDLIVSLPLFPWIDAEVTALAEHPLSRPEEQ